MKPSSAKRVLPFCSLCLFVSYVKMAVIRKENIAYSDTQQKGITMQTVAITTAILIDSPKIVQVMTAFDPTIQELDYETDLHENYFVLDFPENGRYVIMPPDVYHEKFEETADGISINLIQVQTR